MTDPLIFVDANVFLKLYGSQTQETISKFMAKLYDERERVVINEQLVMEVLNNRLTQFADLKAQLKVAPLIRFSSADERKAIAKSTKVLNGQLDPARKALENVIQKPEKYDEIYKMLAALLDHGGPLCLTPEMQEYAEVVEWARRRYLLHYPPRKNDQSYGDGLHWEWLVRCAAREKRDAVIVSQDSDFGQPAAGIINDFLRVEFLRRTKQNVKLVDRLGEGIPLPVALAKAEKAAVEKSKRAAPDRDLGREVAELGRLYLLRSEGLEVFPNSAGLLNEIARRQGAQFRPADLTASMPDATVADLVQQPPNPLLGDVEEDAG